MIHSYTIFSAHYAPHVGGVESFTANLAHALVRQGNQVCIATMRIDDSPEFEIDAENVHIFRFPCHAFMKGRLPWTKRNAAYRSLMQKLREHGCDRVLVNTRFYPHSLEGLRFAKRLNMPAVLLDHGTAHLSLGSKCADAVIGAYEHIITAKVKRFHPIFCGISKASTEWLSHFGIKTRLVVPNAIDADTFRQLSSFRDFKQELKLAKSTRLVVCVGRLTPEKGVMVLADAAKQLSNTDCAFIFAGEGFLRSSIEEIESKNVYLLGNISAADLSALLQQADIFCLPSRSEGFCTSLLEAAACGIAPIITCVGGTQELIGQWNSDGSNIFEVYDTGIIINGMYEESVESALKFLLLNVDKREQMGRALRIQVENTQTWGKTVQLLEEAFSFSSR